MPDAAPPIRCAGFTLTARRPAPSTTIEHWAATGPDGLGEVYLGPPGLLARASSVPVWGPFPDLRTGRINDGRAFVAIPGSLSFDLEELAARLSPGAAAALAWHIASALAEVHDRGGAHGALHPAFVGLDARGRLSLRPAFAATLPAEPDPAASAQATDCLQLGHLLEVLSLDRLDEPGLTLLRSGLTKERARYRMAPGRSVRQALSALLARHSDWEAALVESLGAEWRLSNALRMPPKPTPSPEIAPVRVPAVGAPEPARVLAVAVPAGPSAPLAVSLPAPRPAQPAPAAVPPLSPAAAREPEAAPPPAAAPLPRAPRPESPSRVFSRGDGLRLTVFPGPNARFEDDDEDDDVVEAPLLPPPPPLAAAPSTPEPAAEAAADAQAADAAPVAQDDADHEPADGAPAADAVAPVDAEDDVPDVGHDDAVDHAQPEPQDEPKDEPQGEPQDDPRADPARADDVAPPRAARAPAWASGAPAAAPPDPAFADDGELYNEDEDDPPTRPDDLPALDAPDDAPDPASASGGEAGLLAAVSAGLAQDDWAPEPSAPPPPRVPGAGQQAWSEEWEAEEPPSAPPPADLGLAPAVVDPVPMARAFPSLQMGRSSLAPSEDDVPETIPAPLPLSRSPLAAAAPAWSPPEPAPAPPPRPLDPAPPQPAQPLPPTTPEQPKWEGVRGVTGDARREDELGAGKWTESARSLAEVQGELAAGPAREIEPLDDGKGSKVFLIIGLCATAGLVLWWALAG